MVALCGLADATPLAKRVFELYTAPEAKQRALVSALVADRPAWEELDAAVAGALPYPAGRTGLITETVAMKDGKDTRRIPINLYVPASYSGAKAFGVLLFLHSAGGSGLPWAEQLGDVANENSMIVCAPTEPGSLNKGWVYSPFQRTMHRDSLDWLRRHYHIDDDRIVVGGVSRGGHGAWDLAFSYPDQFAGLLGLIGGPAPDRLALLPSIAHLDFLCLQGAKDEAGIVEPVRKAVAALKGLGGNVLYQEDAEAGHSFHFESVDLSAWLSGVLRRPFPKKVTVMTAGESGRRSFWLEIVKVVQDAGKQPLPARAAGEIDGNEIRLQVENVRELKLHLHEQLLPLARVKVLVNGQVRHEGRVAKNLGGFLREMLERGDRRARCMGELTVRP